MKKRFKELSKEERVEFFVNCQKILIKYHPKSEFLTRKDNLKHKLDASLDLIHNYKGYYYSDENACILWNYIYIENPKNPTEELIKNANKEPNPNYNAARMDLIICRKSSDMIQFIKENDEERVKYLLSIKYQREKILLKEDLLKNLKFF